MSDEHDIQDAIENFRAGRCDPRDMEVLVQFAEALLDDEPPSMAELEPLLDDPEFPPVERDGKRFAWVQGYVEVKTRGQLRALLKGLGQ